MFAARVLALAAVGLALGGCFEGPPEGLRVFTARRIVTLEPDPATATAVAVEAGRIVAVGSLEDVRRSLGERPFTLDERFSDRILLPGFVDPHLHPTLAATILPMEIVSAVSWETPSGLTRAVRGRDSFLARLRELDAALEPGAWLKAWGYHAPYHGSLARSDLDAISRERPIFVWHRSVHEMFFNTKALETLGLARAAFDAHPQADWSAGHLWEAGAMDLGRPMMRILASPTSYRRGLAMMTEVLHRGGLTTVGEQGFPQVNALAERWMLRFSMWRDRAPYRFVLIPNALFLFREHGDAAAAERAAAELLGASSDRIRIVRHAKYYADGAIFSQLMQMTRPYLDGHSGEWMMEPEEQAAVLDAFWRAGWDVHVHVNGDAGLDLVLDQVEEVRARHPAPGRRIVLEHYGYAREDQHVRAKTLDVSVSNNPYYLHELAPIYAERGLGPERAADLSPLGGLARAGLRTSFHSDFPMAPARPLTLVWVAVQRVASDGRVWGPEQRIALDRALRAVTIEAAWSLGLEDEIGTIAPGKRADFTVLERDPYAVAPGTLKDIPVWGTVFEGRPRPLDPPPAQRSG